MPAKKKATAPKAKKVAAKPRQPKAKPQAEPVVEAPRVVNERLAFALALGMPVEAPFEDSTLEEREAITEEEKRAALKKFVT